MSEQSTTQAVVDETKAPAQQGAEENNARVETGDDLDTLLNEFDEGTKPAPAATQPERKPEAASETKEASADILAAASEIRQERFQRDMTATIKDVRGDLPSDLYDDDFMQAWIDTQAKKDPRLANAWVNRNNNAQQFARVKAALGKEFAKRYGKLPDRQATEDREAVTAAVRGASTKAPEGKAPDYSKMTDAEFASEKAKLGL